MSEDHDPPSIFASLKLELERNQRQIQAQAKRGVLSFPPNAVDLVGHTLFANLLQGGICTFIVQGQQSWNPKSHYLEMARLAARRGCSIERIFLLPHRLYRHVPSLKEHIQLDQAAGLKTCVVYIGHLLSTAALPPFDSLDFGVWDDQILCRAVHQATGNNVRPYEWVVSQNSEDVQLAHKLVETLKARGEPVTLEDVERHSSSQEVELEEPMIITAPTATFLSSVLCRGNHVDEDCSWYHSIWQYLRIFNRPLAKVTYGGWR
jgi:hypothetical protein